MTAASAQRWIPTCKDWFWTGRLLEVAMSLCDAMRTMIIDYDDDDDLYIDR